MIELIDCKLNFKLKCKIQNVPTLAMDENHKSDDNDNNGNVKLETNPKTKIPALYRVLMMNDDYTPM